MTKAERTAYRQQIDAGELSAALDSLLDRVAQDHPDRNRLEQLGKRLQELNERTALGTLNPDDIARVRQRIAGGLRDVVQDYKTLAEHRAAPPTEASAPSFTLDLTETEPPAPAAAPDWNERGYFGELDYAGSPTKQERTVVLHKSYGAAYHTAREAVRKAGFEMVRGDRDHGTLEAALAPTGTGGYGEKILLFVTPVAPGTTRVHAVVDSQLPTLAFDFGRHKTKLGVLASHLR